MNTPFSGGNGDTGAFKGGQLDTQNLFLSPTQHNMMWPALLYKLDN